MGMHRRHSATDDPRQRQLHQLQMATDAGIELAPAAALFFCDRHKVPVPDWLVSHAARGYCQQLAPSRPKNRGRSSGILDRCRQDMIDLMRWDLVREARLQQKTFSETLKTDADAPPSVLEHPMKMSIWYGHDWLRAYECASMLLRNTPAFGGPDAIKASYCRVERNMAHPKDSWRYFLFEPEFLETIGLEHPSRWGQSSKWAPLYHLTL